MDPARGFRRALADKAASGDAAVIAEVKSQPQQRRDSGGFSSG